MDQNKFTALVEKHRQAVLDAERWIWQHPESGFKEWKTHAYLAEIFRNAGYELTEAGNIPGFYTDLDTGRPGPKVLIMAELDALTAPNHPESWEGCAHACGHHAQCAAMVGIALALKEPGALDGLSGSIRLMLVPAEELIEVEWRNELRRSGVISYLGGKVEFMHRGYMDGVDIAYLFHIRCNAKTVFDFNDSNGCMAKEITYIGKASHAGGSPHAGINALYAANMGLNAINAIRETFKDNDHVRVHPILNVGNVAVNIIPPKADISTFVRGASMEVMAEANRKVDRALAAGALAIGARVHVVDQPGYAPFLNYPPLMDLADKVLGDLVGKEEVAHLPWGTGSTDMGDVSCVIRTIQPHVGGASGTGHGDDYQLTDPDTACIKSAQAQVLLAIALLENDAAEAKKIMAGPGPRYATKEDYFKAIAMFDTERDLVEYTEDGAKIVF